MKIWILVDFSAASGLFVTYEAIGHQGQSYRWPDYLRGLFCLNPPLLILS